MIIKNAVVVISRKYDFLFGYYGFPLAIKEKSLFYDNIRKYIMNTTSIRLETLNRSPSV